MAKRRFTKYPSNYVKASYLESTEKPTLSGVRACFFGVPKNQYDVVKEDGKILVITGKEIHKYWYAMQNLWSRYNVLRYGKLSSVYEVISVKTDININSPYEFDVQEIDNPYDKYNMYPDR